MASDLEATLHWVHRTNIERYRKILRTHLTAEERRFVERRLAEEQEAVQQCAGAPHMGGFRGDAEGSIARKSREVIVTKSSFAGICRDGKEKS